MTDLYTQIRHRAAATSWMTAVRFDGVAVTYGDLHGRIDEYRGVVESHGLSESSALAAALTSLLPETISAMPPLAQAELVGEAMSWLGRGTETVEAPVDVAV